MPRYYATLFTATWLANVGMWLILGSDKYARLFGVLVALPALVVVAAIAAFFSLLARDPRPAGDALLGHTLLSWLVQALAVGAGFVVPCLVPATGSGC